MASGFFAILDDIAALMDDVAVASKLAKKNRRNFRRRLGCKRRKRTGFLSSRELPVLWAITKGSFLNKLIILPIIFGLNWFISAAIKIILVIGGLYLLMKVPKKL